MGTYGIAALILYLVSCGLLGAVGLGAQVVFEIERLSLSAATIIHFCLTMTFLSILGFGLGWDLKDKGVIITVFCYLGVYCLIWICSNLVLRKKVKKINENLQQWMDHHRDETNIDLIFPDRR